MTTLSQDKIRIAVKGDERDARRELAARGVTGAVRRMTGRTQTFWDVPASQRPAVIAWFCEPGVCKQGFGYPAGTLLHHA